MSDMKPALTAEDVEKLRWLLESREFSAKTELWIKGLADRIEAQLRIDPPETIR